MMLLDTNVFNNRRFLEWIKDQKEEVCTSSISAMELIYHHLKKGMPDGYTISVLRALGIKVVAFDYDSARNAAGSAIGRWDFSDHAADYAILGTAKTLNATLVTENKQHFPYEKTKTPEELMKGT